MKWWPDRCWPTGLHLRLISLILRSDTRERMIPMLKTAFASLILLMPLLAFGQAPAASPLFEVASVKPAEALTPAMITSGKLHVGMSVDGARVDIGFMSLADLIPL